MTKKAEFQGWPIVLWIVCGCAATCLWHGRAAHRLPTEYVTTLKYRPYVGPPKKSPTNHRPLLARNP